MQGGVAAALAKKIATDERTCMTCLQGCSQGEGDTGHRPPLEIFVYQAPVCPTPTPPLVPGQVHAPCLAPVYAILLLSLVPSFLH